MTTLVMAPARTVEEVYEEIRHEFLAKYPDRAVEVVRPSLAIVEERFRFLVAWWLRDMQAHEGTWAKKNGEYRARGLIREMAPNVTPLVLVTMPRACREVFHWHELLGDLTDHAVRVPITAIEVGHFSLVWKLWWSWGHHEGLLRDGCVVAERVTG